MATSSVNLDSVWINLINDTIMAESQPLTRLKTQRDDLKTKQSVYTDVKTKLESLRDQIKTLNSSNAFYAMTAGRKVTVADPSVSGATVFSASASTTAVPGSYTINNIILAKEHRVKSDVQLYYDQALGLSGTFYMGGAESRSTTTTATVENMVNGFSEGTNVTVGQLELGTGSYYVETRNTSGTWQFRLVNSEGKAASIQSGTSGSFTSDWQTIPTDGAAYDTGRGLKINFGTDTGAFVTKNRANGAAQVSYTAQGAAISVTADQTLADIVSNVNKATYAEGNTVNATFINNQLFLSSALSGTSHSIQASDKSGDTILQSLGILNGAAFKNVVQTGVNAEFDVNGEHVIRSQNSALTDVIAGVTLNLASDAQGKSATLKIEADSTGQRNSINSLVTKFNEVMTYLNSKVAVTKNADGTYTRGSLANDQMYVTLRHDMTRIAGTTITNTGTYRLLSQIGIEVTSDMKLSVSDTSKLTKALETDFTNVTKMLDQFATSLENKLNRFVGTSGYSSMAVTSAESQIKNLDGQITTWTTRLTARQEQLIKQYGEVQATLASMSYQQSQLSAIYSTYSTSG